jgi:alginate O-acetyltransferase complex protein AlgI
MYLTDLKDGKAPRYDLIRYGLYIAFFPQVLSGPLARWSEVVHQFDKPSFAPGWQLAVVRGALFVMIGLAEKTFLGDRLAPLVEPAFAAAANGPIAGALAWQGLLAFTFQIFFDFAGYSDIAIGLALLIGIRLPDNFAAPYRATSLQNFWRRWHMTLSRFLRDYLYVRLGGNRHGLSTQLAAIFVTMALGGLWHGANWTFVARGVLRGLGLAAGVLWRRYKLPMSWALAWVLTFGFVTLAWVFFRAPTFAATGEIFQALVTMPAGEFRWRTILIAAIVAFTLPPTARIVERAPIKPWVAVAAGVVFLAVLVDIGGDHVPEFIYFRV